MLIKHEKTIYKTRMTQAEKCPVNQSSNAFRSYHYHPAPIRNKKCLLRISDALSLNIPTPNPILLVVNAQGMQLVDSLLIQHNELEIARQIRTAPIQLLVVSFHLQELSTNQKENSSLQISLLHIPRLKPHILRTPPRKLRRIPSLIENFKSRIMNPISASFLNEIDERHLLLWLPRRTDLCRLVLARGDGSMTCSNFGALV